MFKYKYRQVQWDVKTAQRANIRANKAGGAWDWDELANAFDAPDLLEWGLVTNNVRIACHKCNWERDWQRWLAELEKRLMRK